jgi:hypothetical protein
VCGKREPLAALFLDQGLAEPNDFSEHNQAFCEKCCIKYIKIFKLRERFQMSLEICQGNVCQTVDSNGVISPLFQFVFFGRLSVVISRGF